MGLSFGALGIVLRSSSESAAPASLHVAAPKMPDGSLVERALGLVELRSLLLSVVVVLVSFILAYLTNPTEASFRTHLTELAFRRHLSRLYENDVELDANNGRGGNSAINGIDDGPGGLLPRRMGRIIQQTKHPSPQLDDLTLPTTITSTISGSQDRSTHLNPYSPELVDPSSGSSLLLPTSGSNGAVTRRSISSAEQGFHFANRATISLRTPGHVFRSLGICTIAAIPIVSDGSPATLASDGSASVVLPFTTTSSSASLSLIRKSKTAEGQEQGGDMDQEGRGAEGDAEDEEVTLAGKWFVGAFGKWWLGGTLQLRQQALLSAVGATTASLSTSSGDSASKLVDGVPQLNSIRVNPKSKDGFIAGVLSFRALDLDPITEGLVKNVTDSISAFAGKARKATAGPSNANGRIANNRQSRRSTGSNSIHGSTSGVVGFAPNGSAAAPVPPRPSTPPPLPKSASLPLHTVRTQSRDQHQPQHSHAPPLPSIPAVARSKSHSTSGLVSGTNVLPTSNSAVIVPTHSPARRTSSASLRKSTSSNSLKSLHVHPPSSLGPSPSSLSLPLASTQPQPTPATSHLDTSPIIVDITKQLHASRQDVSELHASLAVFLSQSGAATAVLQASVDASRETKRREDAERAEAKTRLKTLEDAKRHAEGVKREAEKRLKLSLSARDRATTKVEQYAKDMDTSFRKRAAERTRVEESTLKRAQMEIDMREKMEEKKKEICVVEDVIAALVVRTKDLESQIKEEKSALARVEADVSARKKAQREAVAAAIALSSSLPGVSVSGMRPALPLSPVQQPSIPQAPLQILEAVHPSPAGLSLTSASPNSVLPLYQRRSLSNEPDHLHLQPVQAPAPSSQPQPTTQHRHTQSLTGQDDVILSLPGGNSGLVAQSGAFGNGVSRPNPIGSPPSSSSSAAPMKDANVGASSPPGLTLSRGPSLRSNFSPFSDGPLSPFASTLIPSGLFTALDDGTSSLRGTPSTEEPGPLAIQQQPTHSSLNPNSNGNGNIISSPFNWQRAEHIARRPWEHSSKDSHNRSGSSNSGTSVSSMSANGTMPHGLDSTNFLYASVPGAGVSGSIFPILPSRSSYGSPGSVGSSAEFSRFSFQSSPTSVTSFSASSGPNPLSLTSSRESNGSLSVVNEHGPQQGGKRRWFASNSQSHHVGNNTSPHASTAPAPVSGPSPNGPSTANSTSAVKTWKESNLNPDAKVFRFTRGRSFAFTGKAANHAGNGSTHQPSGGIGGIYGEDTNGIATLGRSSNSSLNHPLTLVSSSASAPAVSSQHRSSISQSLPTPPSLPTSSTASFLSSILAFKPSAEERAALERALGQHSGGAWNGSVERLSDHSSSPGLQHAYPVSIAPTATLYGHTSGNGMVPSRTSQFDVTTATNAPTAIWPELYLAPNQAKLPPSNASSSSAVTNSSSGGVAPPAASKRTFSQFWNRKKGGASGAAVTQGQQGSAQAPTPSSSVSITPANSGVVVGEERD